MYSASAVDRDTQFCFLLNHEIRLLPKKKHPPEVLFSVISTSCPVCITIPSENGFTPMRVEHSIFTSTIHIFQDPLDLIDMAGFGFCLIPGTYPNSKGNIRSTGCKIQQTSYHASV